MVHDSSECGGYSGEGQGSRLLTRPGSLGADELGPGGHRVFVEILRLGKGRKLIEYRSR